MSTSDLYFFMGVNENHGTVWLNQTVALKGEVTSSFPAIPGFESLVLHGCHRGKPKEKGIEHE